jgi:putative endonuclease
MIFPGKKKLASVTGIWAEDMALAHLENKGLILIERNYRIPAGEIDLIMKDNELTVFIEVKYRKNNSFYDIRESIDKRKCDRIIKTGLYYQQSSGTGSDMMYRFDIVLVTGDPDRPGIQWIKDAFIA